MLSNNKKRKQLVIPEITYIDPLQKSIITLLCLLRRYYKEIYRHFPKTIVTQLIIISKDINGEYFVYCVNEKLGKRLHLLFNERCINVSEILEKCYKHKTHKEMISEYIYKIMDINDPSLLGKFLFELKLLLKNGYEFCLFCVVHDIHNKKLTNFVKWFLHSKKRLELLFTIEQCIDKERFGGDKKILFFLRNTAHGYYSIFRDDNPYNVYLRELDIKYNFIPNIHLDIISPDSETVILKIKNHLENKILK